MPRADAKADAGIAAVEGACQQVTGYQRPRVQHRSTVAGLSEPATLTRARAAASELAYRCAGALMAATGSSGIFVGGHAQRLVREAAFTLVTAGRSDIKENLLSLFGSAR